jgi:exopolysaccharide biosynthesis polyprenyl glycosylphosphotransferase
MIGALANAFFRSLRMDVMMRNRGDTRLPDIGAQLFAARAEKSGARRLPGRIDLDAPGEHWIESSPRPRSAARSFVKRGGDIVLSMIMLLILLPLLILVAIAIKIDSPGPVLYSQKRVGLNGAIFTLFKFRSMTVDAEAESGARWAQVGDPRITRVGSVIRRTRIDELPQLFNVLRNDMSLVGPRPERPEFVEQLNAVIPHYSERLKVKPGITGWAQTNFPYGASVEDARQKLTFDLYYVRHRSSWLDLIILAMTVQVVLFQKGAR